MKMVWTRYVRVQVVEVIRFQRCFESKASMASYEIGMGCGRKERDQNDSRVVAWAPRRWNCIS